MPHVFHSSHRNKTSLGHIPGQQTAFSQFGLSIKVLPVTEIKMYKNAVTVATKTYEVDSQMDGIGKQLLCSMSKIVFLTHSFPNHLEVYL